MISDLTQREDELGGNTLLIVALLPQADFVALTCPLTAETRPRSAKNNQ
jgi:lactate dehydrogenase-like 2-hydroxyacid dehydrogenase